MGHYKYIYLFYERVLGFVSMDVGEVKATVLILSQRIRPFQYASMNLC